MIIVHARLVSLIIHFGVVVVVDRAAAVARLLAAKEGLGVLLDAAIGIWNDSVRGDGVSITIFDCEDSCVLLSDGFLRLLGLLE